jgi:dihydrodipicolinate reductase
MAKLLCENCGKKLEQVSKQESNGVWFYGVCTCGYQRNVTAEIILNDLSRKQNWQLTDGIKGTTPRTLSSNTSSPLLIVAKREPQVPGTHIVKYESDVDFIEIKHEAKNRKGFAEGAVLAARWLVGKKGVFDMKDLLGI